MPHLADRPTDWPEARSQARREDWEAKALEVGRHRLLTVVGLFVLCFALLSARLIDLSLVRGGGEPSLTRAGMDRPGATGRADIVDRNGVLLATTLRAPSLYANPRVVLDAADAASRLAMVLPNLDRGALLRKLTSERSFVWLRRGLTPRQHYAVNRLGIPGIGFVDEDRRIYPQGALMAHVVGFCGVDNRGLAGVEQGLDALLAAPDRIDRALALSLDVRVQGVVRGELRAAVEEFQSKGGTGIVLDVRTGEALAMVSLPDFDPNLPVSTTSEALFNRASLGVYEMGSTFKTFTTAAALEAGTVDLAGGYDATKPIRVARYTIRDDHPKKRWLSVPEIFVYSSNIGAAKMALELGGDRQRAFLKRLGLLSPPDVELPEVGSPMWPSPWREINTMTVAFGHGIAVSPLQLASAVATLVNSGSRIPATIVRREQGEPIPAQQVVSGETSATMRALLRLVVTEGTGRQAAASGYRVGGKTGTAEKAKAGGYRRDALISSFVGAFPIEEPRYVVFVLLDEPKGNKSTFGFASGGWTAAPAVGRIVSRIAPMLGVAPVAPNEEDRGLTVEIAGSGTSLASF